MIPVNPSGLETQARRERPVAQLEVDRCIAGNAEHGDFPGVGRDPRWRALAENDDVSFSRGLVHRAIAAELGLLSLDVHAK